MIRSIITPRNFKKLKELSYILGTGICGIITLSVIDEVFRYNIHGIIKLSRLFKAEIKIYYKYKLVKK